MKPPDGKFGITARTVAEVSADRGERTLSELIERAPFGIYVIDSQFRIAQMNEGSQNGAFRNVRPVIGRDFSEAMHIMWPDPVAADIIAKFRHTLETGEPYYSPRFVNPRQDITLVESYEWELHRLTLPDEQHGVVCYYFDSTALRKAEQALRQSEQRFRRLVEVSAQTVWTTNAEGEFIEDSPSYRSFTGLEHDQVASWKWIETIHPDDREKVVETWREAVAWRSEYRVEFRQLHHSGEYRHIACQAVPILDSEGQVREWVGMNVDITERKRAQEQLFTANQRLEALMNALPVGVSFSDDPTSQHITGNRTVLKQFEVTPADNLSASARDADAPGRQVQFYIDGKRITDAELPLQRAVVENREIPPIELEIVLPSGKRWFADASGAPVRDAFGNVTGGVAVTVDVTRRKQAELQSQDANRTLRAINHSNRALLRASTEDELLRDVCRIISEDCGYALVWIGYAVQDEAKSVRPAAFSGFGEGYLQTLRISWADCEHGRGPTGRAIRSRQPQVCPNMHTDPDFRPWRQEAERFGYASSLAVPLVHGDACYGAITIYSREPNGFSPSEVELLSELAGNLAYGISAIRTRSAHVEAEEALRQNEARLRFHVENTPLAVIEWGADFRIARWSGEAEKIFGWRADEVLGRHLDEFRWVYEGDRELLGSVSAGLVDGSTPRCISKNRNYRKDGSLISCEWYNSSLTDESGKLISIFSLVLDVTQRDQAEEALRQSESRLTMAKEAAELGIYDYDLTSGSVQWDARVRQLWGVGPNEPVSYDTFISGVHPDHRQAVQASVERALKSGGDRVSQEYRVCNLRNGLERWVLATGNVFFQSGRPTRIVGTLQDITESKRSQELLIRSEKVAALGRMAASLAHDLNNPLAAVVNTIYLAQNSPDCPETVREYLDLADEELRRITHITRQALGFYREDRARTHVLVRTVLDETVGIFASRIKAKQAKVDRDYQGATVEVLASSGELRQVFSNLIANSLDAIEQGGTIKLRVSTLRSKGVRVTVADNGKGIEPDAMPRIFEPLFTTKGTVGTGLGLWVTKQLIEKHGGSIRVRSSSSGGRWKGTAFSVFLPAVAERHRSTASTLPG